MGHRGAALIERGPEEFARSKPKVLTHGLLAFKFHAGCRDAPLPVQFLLQPPP